MASSNAAVGRNGFSRASAVLQPGFQNHLAEAFQLSTRGVRGIVGAVGRLPVETFKAWSRPLFQPRSHTVLEWPQSFEIQHNILYPKGNRKCQEGHYEDSNRQKYQQLR